ncbi:4'-phosphopantetheinyl transferase superfamily protein [Myxococcota bacterium]|nr:4'-phosphopantetheinyl transferase superfamily protein [Myxococcota bacterium]
MLRARVDDAPGWRAWCRGGDAAREAVPRVHPERAIIGPAVTRWYLSRLLGCDPSDVPLLDRHVTLRPDLDRDRLPSRWRQLQLARARTPGRSWVALTVGPLLGIDVEPFCGPRSVELSTFLDLLPPTFAAEVRGAAEADRWRCAVERWTRYEAWAKARGEGISLAPGDPPPEVRFLSFDPGPNLVGSVATLHPVEAVDLRDVRPPPP